MTTPHAGENVAHLTLQLHKVVQQYGPASKAHAVAKAAYMTAHAKKRLAVRASGEATSQAEASMHADADDYIAGLNQDQLIAAAWVDTLKKQIEELKERIGYGRSLMADQREADKLLATNREIA